MVKGANITYLQMPSDLNWKRYIFFWEMNNYLYSYFQVGIAESIIDAQPLHPSTP